MTMNSTNPGKTFLILWLLAGSVAGTLFFSLVSPGPVTFVLLGSLQAILLYRYLSKDAVIWGLGTCIAGVLGAYAGIIITVIGISGVSLNLFLFSAPAALFTGLGLIWFLRTRRTTDFAKGDF